MLYLYINKLFLLISVIKNALWEINIKSLCEGKYNRHLCQHALDTGKTSSVAERDGVRTWSTNVKAARLEPLQHDACAHKKNIRNIFTLSYLFLIPDSAHHFTISS